MSSAPNRDQIRKAIHAQILRVLDEQGKPAVALDDDTKLTSDIGLTSMQLAQIVLDLETEMGGDPFESLVPVTSVRTVGDMVKAYEKLFAAEDDDDAGDDALLAAQNRAQQRRSS